jgi:hypothetical protein
MGFGEWKQLDVLKGADGHFGEIDAAAFSAAGRLALCGGFDSIIRIRDLRTGKIVGRLKGGNDHRFLGSLAQRRCRLRRAVQREDPLLKDAERMMRFRRIGPKRGSYLSGMAAARRFS